MLTDIKLSKAQIFKIIQSGGCLGNILDNLGKKSNNRSCYSPGLVSNLASNAINKFERKISGKRAVPAGKGFTLFILNEDMNDIIEIIKSLEDLGVLIDGATETVKHEIKKNK